MSKKEEAEWASYEAGWAWRDVELLPDEQDSIETQLPENATNNLSTEKPLKNINRENGEMRPEGPESRLACMQKDTVSIRIIRDKLVADL